MTDEPYRWLEAIANRREYIRDQLKGASPVFAFSRPEGILLCGVGVGQSKVFEVYDRHALVTLGHPVDIEKVRQTLIEAAHLEGFTRAPEDVTLRRLLSASLGPLLKNAFEQIFAAPLLIELILAEVGRTPDQDVLVRVGYDGTPRFIKNSIVVAHTNATDEQAAVDWLSAQVQPNAALKDVGRLALRAEGALMSGKPFASPPTEPNPIAKERVIEMAILERIEPNRVHYRSLDASTIS